MSAADLNMLQRPNDRLWRRRLVNRGMQLLCWLAAALAVFLLGVVLWSVAKRGAAALNQEIEACVRLAPLQYLWTYKRFRVRPPGCADLYRKARRGHPASP